MIVGTYLLMARRLSQASEPPDFEHLVTELQLLLKHGISPGPPALLERASQPSRKRSVPP
jgi:hypothetical protein